VRAATGTGFGRPEQLAPPQTPADTGDLPGVAVDPVSGRAIAVWGFIRISDVPGQTVNLTRYAVRAPIDAAP